VFDEFVKDGIDESKIGFETMIELTQMKEHAL